MFVDLITKLFGFWDFLKSYLVCPLVVQLVFIIFFSDNQVPFQLLWENHLGRYLQVPKYYEHDCKFQKWHSWIMVLLILTKYISFQLLINRIQRRVSKNNSKKTKKNKTVVRFQTWVYQNVSNEVLLAWFNF